MKNNIGVFFCLLIAGICSFTSCKKPADHSIRIKNDFTAPFASIKFVGGTTVSFSDIKPNTVTDYKPIPEDKYFIKGDITSDDSIPFEINGKGKHKWTIRIYPDPNSKLGDMKVVKIED